MLNAEFLVLFPPYSFLSLGNQYMTSSCCSQSVCLKNQNVYSHYNFLSSGRSFWKSLNCTVHCFKLSRNARWHCSSWNSTDQL